jgi:hypothetical protein
MIVDERHRSYCDRPWVACHRVMADGGMRWRRNYFASACAPTVRD